MQTLLPDLRVGDDIAGLLRPAGLFDHNPEEVWLEIGFGGGEHLAWQARHNPDTGLIGCEPFVNGVASLLASIDDHADRNIRIHDGDARVLLAGLGDHTIDKCFVLFPDPWPKKRHHKRRIINPHTLAALHRIMRPGAELRVASDIAGFVRWTLGHVCRHGGFDWQVECCDDWRNRPEDWPETRYEAKAIAAGRRPAYLTFRRSP